MAAGGHTVPGSPSVYLQMEARNAGDGGDQFPCEERFGPEAMCDDDRARVLDIRRTAAAPHPVTLRYNGRDGTIRGRTAITVRGTVRAGNRISRSGGTAAAAGRRACRSGSAPRASRNGMSNPDEEDP